MWGLSADPYFLFYFSWVKLPYNEVFAPKLISENITGLAWTTHNYTVAHKLICFQWHTAHAPSLRGLRQYLNTMPFSGKETLFWVASKRYSLIYWSSVHLCSWWPKNLVFIQLLPHLYLTIFAESFSHIAYKEHTIMWCDRKLLWFLVRIYFFNSFGPLPSLGMQ